MGKRVYLITALLNSLPGFTTAEFLQSRLAERLRNIDPLRKAVSTQRRTDKRGALEICADMLMALEGHIECNRATLATESKLDSRALSKYLEILQAHELVEVTPGNRKIRIRISEKGRAYLEHYGRMASLLRQ